MPAPGHRGRAEPPARCGHPARSCPEAHPPVADPDRRGTEAKLPVTGSHGGAAGPDPCVTEADTPVTASSGCVTASDRRGAEAMPPAPAARQGPARRPKPRALAPGHAGLCRCAGPSGARRPREDCVSRLSISGRAARLACARALRALPRPPRAGVRPALGHSRAVRRPLLRRCSGPGCSTAPCSHFSPTTCGAHRRSASHSQNARYRRQRP